MDRRKLGQRVRALRVAKGWNQVELEAKSGVSERSIQDIEAGKGNPSLGHLEALGSALGAPLIQMPGSAKASVPDRATQPQHEPRWPELARLFQYYGDAEPDERLLALYMLSENPDYIEQYAAIDPEHAADAAALKRIL